MESMRWWNKDPDQWARASAKAHAQMLAHYREYHLRESHTRAQCERISKEWAKKKEKKD